MKFLDKLFIIGAILCLLTSIILYNIGKNEYDQKVEEPQLIITNEQDLVLEDTTDAEGFATEKMEKAEVVTYKSVLKIPSQDVIVNIYSGVTKKGLKTGVCRYEETSSLGAIGTTVICGHASSKWDYVFNRLKYMSVDDEFIIWDDLGKEHTYTVTSIYIVEPTDTWILEQDDLTCSKVRLFCCTNKGKQRLVIEGVDLSSRKEYYIERQNKLVDINNSLEYPNKYLEILNWYDLGSLSVEVDENLSSHFYTDFGIHIN